MNALTPANLTNGTFNRADRVFASNPRVIQMGVRFDF